MDRQRENGNGVMPHAAYDTAEGELIVTGQGPDGAFAVVVPRDGLGLVSAAVLTTCLRAKRVQTNTHFPPIRGMDRHQSGAKTLSVFDCSYCHNFS